MSLYDYQLSKRAALAIDEYIFYTVVMALFRRADTSNLEALKSAFADTFDEFWKRYNAPGGLLAGE